MASPLDSTAIGIVAGLVATGTYSFVRAWRQRTFDIRITMLMFLAGFALPGGAHLITAALSGNPSSLPSTWREYVAVAGIAAIGLSAHQIVQSFRYVWSKRGAATISNESEMASQASITDDSQA